MFPAFVSSLTTLVSKLVGPVYTLWLNRQASRVTVLERENAELKALVKQLRGYLRKQSTAIPKALAILERMKANKL